MENNLKKLVASMEVWRQKAAEKAERDIEAAVHKSIDSLYDNTPYIVEDLAIAYELSRGETAMALRVGILRDAQNFADEGDEEAQMVVDYFDYIHGKFIVGDGGDESTNNHEES
ncbi:hypothetical protein N9S00_08110 [Luminiphilus sp.]|nr:hypothetical protein [Luminiphilus sp.]